MNLGQIPGMTSTAVGLPSWEDDPNTGGGPTNTGESGGGFAGAGAILGGLLGFLGQKDTNAQNLQLGREQMQFQERMSGTAYQRAVADMAKAGINPMLATQVGGASSPSGALPIMQNAVGAGVASANQAMQTFQGAQQIQQTKAQTDQITAQADKIRSETMEKDVNAKLLAAQVEAQRLKNLDTEAAIPGTRTDSSRKQMAYRTDMGETLGPGFTADRERRIAEAKAAQLAIPGSKAEADFFNTEWGHSSPYIQSILGIVRGVSNAARAAK